MPLIQRVGQSELTEQAAGKRVVGFVHVDTVGHVAPVHREPHVKRILTHVGQCAAVNQTQLGPRAGEADGARRFAAGVRYQRELAFHPGPHRVGPYQVRDAAAAVGVIEQLAVEIEQAAAFIAGQAERLNGELGPQTVLRREEGVADTVGQFQLRQHIRADKLFAVGAVGQVVFNKRFEVLLIEGIQRAAGAEEAVELVTDADR